MVRFIDVYKEYKKGVKALNGISFTIEDGQMAFLVGPSGSGKSTIIRLINGETAPTSGKIMVNGYNLTAMHRADIPYMRRTLGVVFQDFRLVEKKTVFENVAFAMRVIGASRRDINKKVPEILEQVGLGAYAHRRPTELSGGEQQRVAIARALVNAPEMIVADEPTGNLDPAMSLEIMQLLEKINAGGTTVLVVTHEKALVDTFSKRVIAIRNGSIVSDETGGYVL